MVWVDLVGCLYLSRRKTILLRMHAYPAFPRRAGFASAVGYCDCAEQWADAIPSGPGRWNNLDALEIGALGSTMTEVQEQAIFSLYVSALRNQGSCLVPSNSLPRLLDCWLLDCWLLAHFSFCLAHWLVHPSRLALRKGTCVPHNDELTHARPCVSCCTARACRPSSRRRSSLGVTSLSSRLTVYGHISTVK